MTRKHIYRKSAHWIVKNERETIIYSWISGSYLELAFVLNLWTVDSSWQINARVLSEFITLSF